MLSGLGNDRGRWGRPVRTGRRDKPVIHLPSIAVRVAVIAGVAIVVFVVVLFRLWFLQILSGSEYVAEANDNRLRSVKVAAARGSIVDRNGTVIVENRPGLAVGIRLMDVPAGKLDSEVVRLAKPLRMQPGAIRKKIMTHLKPSWPASIPFTWANVVAGDGVSLDLAIVKDDVSRKVVSYLLEHTQSFPGVEIQKSYLRSYPHGTFAAQLLGHVQEISAEQLEQKHFKGYSAGDIVGVDGLEWTYDRWLRGRDGVNKIEVDAYGRPKSSEPVSGGRLAEAGDTLVTTLDAKVQSAAEDALTYGLKVAHADGEVEANGGAAVVLDADNGEVLGMASYPTYDPSLWVGGISTKNYDALTDKDANNPLLNRAIQESKAVGSTFKVVDAIAGLEEGVITPSKTFYCDGGYIAPGTLDKHRFECWSSSGHGWVNLVSAITESCDVYFYNVGYLFYRKEGTLLEDWAKSLGMGKATGIDLPGEYTGRVPTPKWKKSYFESEVDKIWKPGDSILLSIGQGNLEATPLQLAVTYAAIANGGSVVTPHLGKKIVDSQGKLVRALTFKKPKKLDILQSTLDTVRTGLRQAASSSTGTSAAVFGSYPVAVAGKTGTAEVWDNGRYVNYAWYASYAPADDPKYVVVVMIEKGGHGGSVAAPAARLIYDALFHVDTGEFTGTVTSD